jgi:DNA-binding response OmpR family regulator
MLCDVAHRVLIVEDDDGIALPLVRLLEREGYDVDRVGEGSLAIDKALSDSPGLIILDLGLPDMDGLEVCRKVREKGYDAGILILTARDGELDRVVGLDVGADDYLAKPFGLAELLARVRALLRRSAPVDPSEDEAAVAAEAPLRVDVSARRAWVEGTEVQLTSKEFDVLAILWQDKGTAVTRERLMTEVWDENWYGSTKTLDVTIGRLRQKLEEAGSSVHVVNLRGVGFRLDDSPSDA